MVLLVAGCFAIGWGYSGAEAGPIHASVLFPQETYLTSPGTTQPFLVSVIAADVNGDGLPDVIAASQLPGTIAWYKNLGNGDFSPRQVISTALGTPSGVYAADLNGDGLVDIACSAFLDNKVAWFENLGGTTPNFILHTISTVANLAQSIAAANINGEPGIDVLSTSANSDNKVAWYPNIPVGSFGARTVISTAANSPSSITLGDLDGNGILDLVVTSTNDNSIAWFKGAAPISGIPQFTRHVIAANQPRAVASAIADIDGDGWPDVLCATPFVGDATSGIGHRITWFRNRTHDAGATAPFFGSGQVITGFAPGAYAVASADLNSDGKPDAVAGLTSGARVTWYENLGGGNFGWNAGDPAANEKIISLIAIEAISVATADFNQDGTIDVVAGSNGSGEVVAYLNRGGQCALASVNTAPASIASGARDDVLRITAGNRGIAGDNNAQLFSVTLHLEKSAGVSMTTSEANALIENLQIFVDSNSSGAFESATDALVGSVGNLQLSAGRLTATLTPGNVGDVLIAPASTRNFFVVAEMTASALTQNPNSFRVTHIGQGIGRSVAKDASSGAILTLESAANADAPSSFVIATTSLSPIEAWRLSWFGMTANSGNAANGANPDGDASNNLMEFASGTNPIVSQSNAISINASVITPGSPTTVVTNTPGAVDFRAMFGRRSNYLAAGLGYTVEFSADLIAWVPSADPPTIVLDDGTLQAVTVPYPLFINGKKARFFHLVITGP